MSKSRIAPYLREDFAFNLAPSVVKWAEGNLILPPSMSPSQPGPFSIRHRPMMRPILECFHPTSGVRDCDFTAGAQFGKTTVGTIGSSYRVIHSPMPQLIFGKSEDWLQKEISEKRLRALIDANPCLAVHKPYDTSKYRKMYMEMSGGTIALEGSDSNIASAGSTQGIVWICEAAKIEHRASEQVPEAHPIKLALERTKEFRGLEFHYSDFTPNSSTHLAWLRWEAGDQTHFHVPCPHCGGGNYFAMEFEFHKGEAEDAETVLESSKQSARPDYYRSLVWSPDARHKDGTWNEEKIIESARYICPHNGCEIQDADKPAMFRAYEEKRHNLRAPKSHRSFRIPSFYSPRVRLGDMANEFLKGGDLFTTGLQNFFNSWLAKPWEKVAANIKDEDVRKLVTTSHYRRGTIPGRPYGLALAADVGDYRCHWEAGAIYDNDEIAVIDWGTVLTIEDLPKLFDLKYPILGTTEELSPFQGLVDSKDQTLRVYDMCSRSRGKWFPSYGSAVSTGSWGHMDLKTHPLTVFMFNTQQFKKELYVQLIKRQKAPRFYLPMDADEELIHGHAHQQLIVKDGKEQFKRIPGDHYGDCSIRLLLTKLIWRAARGLGAPDMVTDQPPPADKYDE